LTLLESVESMFDRTVPLIVLYKVFVYLVQLEIQDYHNHTAYILHLQERQYIKLFYRSYWIPACNRLGFYADWKFKMYITGPLFVLLTLDEMYYGILVSVRASVVSILHSTFLFFLHQLIFFKLYKVNRNGGLRVCLSIDDFHFCVVPE